MRCQLGFHHCQLGTSMPKKAGGVHLIILGTWERESTYFIKGGHQPDGPSAASGQQGEH